MKSVNTKNKTGPLTWRKYSFYFRTPDACNSMAMPIAAALRQRCALLYFARYTGALESRLDVYFATSRPLPAKDPPLITKNREMRWTKLVGPTTCEGSLAHGWAFDAVVRISAALSAMPPQMQRQQFIDVVHWMHNMFGLDYVDEARCHLHSINCIMNVFENSIRLGNKIAKGQRKAPKASKN